MKDFTRFFDAVYAINLEHRMDRWETITRMGKEAGLTVNHWDATKAADIDVEKHRIGVRVRKPTCIACWSSHTTLYRHALKEGYDRLLVLEDDAELLPDLHEKLTDLFDSFDFGDFDLIYLGAVDKYPAVKLQDNVYRCQHTLTTHAMLFTRQGLQKVIDIVDQQDEGKCRMSIDVFLAENIQPMDKTYRCEPAIIKFIDGYSDIAGWKRSWKEAEKTIIRQGTRNPKKWESFVDKGKSKLF